MGGGGGDQAPVDSKVEHPGRGTRGEGWVGEEYPTERHICYLNEKMKTLFKIQKYVYARS